MREPIKGLIALFAAGLLVLTAVSPAFAWTSEQWAMPWPNADRAELRFDTSGFKYIVYQRDCQIYYRTNKSGSWVAIRLRATTDAVICNALQDAVVTPDGKVYFAYLKETWTGLQWQFGTNAKGSWSYRDAVAPADHLYTQNSTIAVTSGVVRIAYTTLPDPSVDREGGLFVRSYWTNGTVSATRLVTGDVAGPDFEADADGKLHVVAEFDDALRYFTNRSGAWVARLFASGPGNRSPQLAVDPQGHPHIAWHRCTLCDGSDADPRLIVYATNQSGAWASQAVRRGGHPSGPLITYSNGPHVVWSDFGPNLERVMWYGGKLNGAWQYQSWTFPLYMELPTEGAALSVAAIGGHPSILYFEDQDQKDPPVDIMGIKTN